MTRGLRLLACFLFAACAAPSRLVILHINDWHGQIQPREVTTRPRVTTQMGGFAAVAAYVARERECAKQRGDTVVWLTDGGDWFQGTPEGNEDRGWSMMACQNRLGFTAVVIGNHDYDFGEANLIRLVEHARHPVLGANILERGDHPRLRPYVKPFRILRIGAVCIAIVGLITEDTKELSRGPFGKADFGGEMVTLRRLLPDLERRTDAIVLLTHCGAAEDEGFARAFPSIDLILGGHSHTRMPRGRRVGHTWIVQSGGRGTGISRVEIDVDQAARRLRVRSAALVPIPARTERDPATERFLATTFAHIGAKWDVPVGVITGDEDKRARGAITSTAAGNYVAGLIRRVAGADVGLMNKGGIRDQIRPGPITRRQVFRLLPFDNTVSTVQLTGVQLRTLLALGLQRPRRPLEIAGARYGFRVVDGVRRLAWVEVGGKPLVHDASYSVATNSFLAGGGDGFELLATLDSHSIGPEWLRALMLTDLREKGEVHLSAAQRIRHVE